MSLQIASACTILAPCICLFRHININVYYSTLNATMSLLNIENKYILYTYFSTVRIFFLGGGGEVFSLFCCLFFFFALRVVAIHVHMKNFEALKSPNFRNKYTTTHFTGLKEKLFVEQ